MMNTQPLTHTNRFFYVKARNIARMQTPPCSFTLHLFVCFWSNGEGIRSMINMHKGHKYLMFWVFFFFSHGSSRLFLKIDVPKIDCPYNAGCLYGIDCNTIKSRNTSKGVAFIAQYTRVCSVCGPAEVAGAISVTQAWKRTWYRHGNIPLNPWEIVSSLSVTSSAWDLSSHSVELTEETWRTRSVLHDV